MGEEQGQEKVQASGALVGAVLLHPQPEPAARERAQGPEQTKASEQGGKETVPET